MPTVSPGVCGANIKKRACGSAPAGGERGWGGVKARTGLSHPRFLRLVCYLPAFRRGPQIENKFYNMPLTYIFPFGKVIIKTSLSDFVKKTRKRKMFVIRGAEEWKKTS